MRWRYFQGLCCILVLQGIICTTICSTYRTLVTDQVWNPITLIIQLLYAIIKPVWIIKLILPCAALIVLTRIHIKLYSGKF